MAWLFFAAMLLVWIGWSLIGLVLGPRELEDNDWDD